MGTQVRLCGTTRREALTAVLPARPLDRDWPSGGTELVAPIVGGNQSTAACRIRASVSTFFQLRGQICANGHLHAGTAGCTTSEPENASRGSNHTYLGAPPSRKSGGGPFHGAVSTGPRRQPRPPAMPTAVVTKQGDFLISVRTGGSETVPYNPPYPDLPVRVLCPVSLWRRIQRSEGSEPTCSTILLIDTDHCKRARPASPGEWCGCKLQSTTRLLAS